MAYSRWINSIWHIFRIAKPRKTKESEVLSVGIMVIDHKEFTYKQLTHPDFNIREHFPNAQDFDDALKSISQFIIDA